MADLPTEEPTVAAASSTSAAPEPAPPAPAAGRARRTRAKKTGGEEPTPPAPKGEKALATQGPTEPEKAAAEELPTVPRRATLAPRVQRALTIRRALDEGRPLFVRQQAHRYRRVGRDVSWRRPRGLQSKQRRHYGYRPVVVSVGYRSPALARGLVPSGFKPVRVETIRGLERIDPLTEAAILSRGIGTRRRLVLEETARKLGVRVLNPIATPESEE